MRVLLLALLFPLACLAEPATLLRAAELKKQPATDADTVLALAENTVVETLERRGGWTRVGSSTRRNRRCFKSGASGAKPDRASSLDSKDSQSRFSVTSTVGRRRVTSSARYPNSLS